MVTILRPLSISELLDRTFYLYRNHFLLFVGIAAIPQLLVFAGQIGVGPNEDPRYLSRFLIGAFGLGLVGFLAIEIAHAATVIAVSNIHLEHSATIASAYSLAKTSFIRVVRISLSVLFIPMMIVLPIAVVIMVVAGIGAAASGLTNVFFVRIGSILVVLAAFLVGLRWWLAWSLVVPVTVLEGVGLRTSMRRSKTLTEGSRGRIFLIYLLLGIFGWVIASAIQFPVLAIFRLHPFHVLTNITPLAHAALAAGNFVSTSLIAALGEIALTLVYYDQRIRKEAFDLELMMANLQPGVQTAAAASPAS